MVIPARAKSPLSSSHCPDINITKNLGLDDASYYQSLIVILQLMAGLGCIDICVGVFMVSLHLALPRMGHLEHLHIFGYPKKHHNAEMPSDPMESELDESKFECQDWSQSDYGEAKEEVPLNIPKPCGQGFTTRVCIDSDHAGESLV